MHIYYQITKSVNEYKALKFRTLYLTPGSHLSYENPLFTKIEIIDANIWIKLYTMKYTLNI